MSKKSFFYIKLGFTQSHPGPLNDRPAGYIRKKAGVYQSEKPTNINGIDKIHLKCDCIIGSIVNGVREPILFSFAVDKLTGHKIQKALIIKVLEKNLCCLILHSI